MKNKPKKVYTVITAEHVCPNCFHRQVYGVKKCSNCHVNLDWSKTHKLVTGEFKG